MCNKLIFPTGCKVRLLQMNAINSSVFYSEAKENMLLKLYTLKNIARKTPQN